MPTFKSTQMEGEEPKAIANYCASDHSRGFANKQKSASQIKQNLELNVTKRQIQQILSGTEYLKYIKSMKAPAMTDHQRKKRVEFANEMLGFYHPDWTKVVFTDEKKFNLDGTAGFNCY